MKSQIFVLTLIILGTLAGGLSSQEEDIVYVTAVAWSHDGSKIAVVGIRQTTTQGYLRVIDVQTGAVLYSFDPNPGGFTSVDWSHDDRFIAVGGYDQVVWIFDIEMQTHVTSLWGHQSTVSAVAWHPEGSLMVSTGNWDGLTILWDMTTYQQIRVVEAGDLFPLTVGFSPDGQKIAIGGEGGIRIYPTHSALEQEPLWYFRELNVAALAWNHTGDHIAFSTQTFPSLTNPNQKSFSQLHLIDSDSGIQLKVLPTDDITIYGLDWNPDDRFIASHSIDGFVRIWEINTGIQVENYPGMLHYPSDISFSPYGGRLAYGTAVPIDATTGENRYAQHTDPLHLLANYGIQIIVPDRTPERLHAIAEACGVTLPTNSRADLTAQLDAVKIPPACRADLLAVAAALESD
jgi:WD40 repeat protein